MVTGQEPKTWEIEHLLSIIFHTLNPHIQLTDSQPITLTTTDQILIPMLFYHGQLSKDLGIISISLTHTQLTVLEVMLN